MNEIVNVINLTSRPERMESFIRQAKDQQFEYKRWEGVLDNLATFRGISTAHKNIVKYAKATNKPYAFIAEDDCIFTAPGAWDYYFKSMPPSFDLYFSGVYEGKIVDNRLVKGKSANEMLAGLTLYCVASRFYDVFLNINPMAHLDKALAELSNDYEFYVVPEFCTKQMNGYSDQKKRFCYYDKYLKGRKMFGG